ncbi:hypothetical protein SLEP1_g51957 [Rubroshorea leprosula]|uniref:Mediator complex subunit 15 KIX domain-containing protein n=1 Tax=Rubroshorea leprosula TaxID=152421 RepID=A0AAV5M5M4_9ROSI|nr:hypothetical protein SLEP1_g51957 [Rubroshorea leprosula]
MYYICRVEKLSQHLPCGGEELDKLRLREIAERFEERIYTAATSQSDYSTRISSKMLSIETNSQETLPNPGSSSNS